MYRRTSTAPFVVAMILIATITAIALMAGKSHGAAPERTHDVVVLRAFESGENVNGSYHYTGFSVYVSSSSLGAPVLAKYPDPATVQLSQAISDLMAQGFKLDRISPYSETYIFIR